MSYMKRELEDHIIFLSKYYGLEEGTVWDAYLYLDGDLETLEKLLKFNCLFLAFPPYTNDPNERRKNMKDSFIFSEKTSSLYASGASGEIPVCHEIEMGYNETLIRAQSYYLADLLNTKGYLYLNAIYEAFGVRFPYKEKENLLFTVDDPMTIVSDYAYGDKFFTINIYSNYDAEALNATLDLAKKDIGSFKVVTK